MILFWWVEKKGQILSLTESVTVPFGAFDNALKTHNFSAIDKDLREHKSYAKGIGVIKEIDLNSGEEVVLIEFMPPAK